MEVAVPGSVYPAGSEGAAQHARSPDPALGCGTWRPRRPGPGSWSVVLRSEPMAGVKADGALRAGAI